MNQPQVSAHFASRQPSAIRSAQIKFAQREDGVIAINTAIGNVSLPMHPAMQDRMFALDADSSPFKHGVVKYSATVGLEETNQAFLNVISASGFESSELYSQVTDGGSQAMELTILGTCGPAGSGKQPLLLLDAAYTNYAAMTERLGRSTISVTRELQRNGNFTIPDFSQIEAVIQAKKPGALLVIPYDNPTGQYLDLDSLTKLARLCVKHNIWLVSDEAYRELHYTDSKTSSIWGVTEAVAPGVTGRRISIESTSKVWNACGIRIGALITDNHEFHQKSVAENTASLCSNVLGQYIFGAIAHQPAQDLGRWFTQQRQYYHTMIHKLTSEFKAVMPNIIVSTPEAAIYSVVDVKDIVSEDFEAEAFVDYCALHGSVQIDTQQYTLLVSPMADFYTVADGQNNPGRTQMRIAYVESTEMMARVPAVFCSLLHQYLSIGSK